MSEKIVGRKLCHECYDTGYSKSITYDRRVEKVNKRQLDVIHTFSYWK